MRPRPPCSSRRCSRGWSKPRCVRVTPPAAWSTRPSAPRWKARATTATSPTWRRVTSRSSRRGPARSRSTAGCSLGRGRLDLNGVVKAAAVDDALRLLSGRGFVSAGGDLATNGPLDVELPGGGSVRLVAGGLATSGRTKRRWLRGGEEQHHLIDPATGQALDEPVGRGHRLRRHLPRGRRRRQGRVPARRRRPGLARRARAARPVPRRRPRPRERELASAGCPCGLASSGPAAARRRARAGSSRP